MPGDGILLLYRPATGGEALGHDVHETAARGLRVGEDDQAKLPPQVELAMAPVSGDLVVTTKRLDWGAIVPVTGPVEKMIAIRSS